MTRRLVRLLLIAIPILLAGCGGATAPSAPASTAASAAAAAAKAASAAAAPSAAAKPASASAAAKPPAAASAAAKQLTAVQAAYPQVSAVHTPLYVAKDEGFFANNGLDVALKIVQGPAETASLISGELQFGDFGGNELTDADLG